MSVQHEIEVVETYRGVPIVQLGYAGPTLLSQETHLQEVRTLLDLPFARFAILYQLENISYCPIYGPEEMAEFLRSETWAELLDRVIIGVRCGAGSLTSTVQIMSAHTLLRDQSSNFAPDRDAALRTIRRSIDNWVDRQAPETELEELAAQP